jgi:hypothetical protein
MQKYELKSKKRIICTFFIEKGQKRKKKQRKREKIYQSFAVSGKICNFVTR